jgi:hypothetical protein
MGVFRTATVRLGFLDGGKSDWEDRHRLRV